MATTDYPTQAPATHDNLGVDGGINGAPGTHAGNRTAYGGGYGGGPGTRGGGYGPGNTWGQPGGYNDVRDDPSYVPQPGFPVYPRRIGNPTPLGLYSLATTTLLLGMYTVNARGVQSVNAVIGMALVVGGLTQILAGMWEFAIGNTFAATAFSTYGGFFFSIGIALIPGTGATAFSDSNQARNAYGLYMMVWFIFGFCLWIGTIRSSFSISALYFFLWMALMLAMIGLMIQSHRTTKAGGGLAIVASAFAYYVATSNLLHDNFGTRSWLPVMEFPKGNRMTGGTTGTTGSTGLHREKPTAGAPATIV